jgi:hypothetical protein
MCKVLISVQLIGKNKVHPRTSREGPEGVQMHSCTTSLASALDGGGWLTPRPGRLIRGKEARYVFCRGLSGPQGRSGRVQQISPAPGFDPRTVLPVASRYTDWAISAPLKCNNNNNNNNHNDKGEQQQ